MDSLDYNDLRCDDRQIQYYEGVVFKKAWSSGFCVFDILFANASM